MADDPLVSIKRDPIKSSVGQAAGQRRRQQAVSVAKERREALVRTKRLCRAGIGAGDDDIEIDSDMILDEEQAVLDSQTSTAVEELKTCIVYQGKGAMQKRVSALRELRRLLSKSEFPPVEAALKAGVMPILVQCLSFGSPDEQLHEAAWCLTNIAAGKPEETKSLLPALPLLIAHLGEKSSRPVAEQCAWALGNVAGEDEELRNVLLLQGALLPLARMMLPDRGSTVRTAAWAISNLIKGPNPGAATELIRIDGVLDAIIRHLKRAAPDLQCRRISSVSKAAPFLLPAIGNHLCAFLAHFDKGKIRIDHHYALGDEELATEVAWVVVYLSALSNIATSMMVKNNAVELLVERLTTSNNLQLLIPVLRSLGNLVAGDTHTISVILVAGNEVTDKAIAALVKCLRAEHRVLKKEASWVLSNIAAGSTEHKKLIYSSEAVPLLLRIFSTAPFDIKKEAAYVLGNLCVAPTEKSRRPTLIVEHLVSLVGKGCLRNYIDLVRSADLEAAKLGLQFIELVLRGMPNGEGPKLVEREDGIEAMERFQFHENEELRIMANGLVDAYFGEDYGLE